MMLLVFPFLRAVWTNKKDAVVVFKIKTGRDSKRRCDLIGAGVRRGQPTEEALVSCGRVLTRRPVPRHVVGIGDHQLSTVEVCAENKWDVLHPVDNGSGLGRHLQNES